MWCAPQSHINCLATELSVGWASSHTFVIMETFLVDGVPETTLSLALFKNVKNAAHLKSKYLNQVALLDAGKRQYPPLVYHSMTALSSVLYSYYEYSTVILLYYCCIQQL